MDYTVLYALVRFGQVRPQDAHERELRGCLRYARTRYARVTWYLVLPPRVAVLPLTAATRALVESRCHAIPRHHSHLQRTREFACVGASHHGSGCVPRRPGRGRQLTGWHWRPRRSLAGCVGRACAGSTSLSEAWSR